MIKKILLFLFVSFLILCSMLNCKNSNQQTTIIDISKIKREITINDSIINISKDTTKIIQHQQKNLELYKKLNDWSNWCRTEFDLFYITSDNSLNVVAGKEYLDAIINQELLFQKNDTLKYYLAKAYGNRYYIYDQQNLTHKVIADCEKYLQFANDSINKEYLSFVLNASGIAYSKIGDQQQSIIKLERLLNLQKNNQEQSESLTATYVNLSNSYYNNANKEKSITIASEGLGVLHIIDDHKASLQAIIANVAIQQKDFVKASINIESALFILQKTKEYSRIADLWSIYGDLNVEKNKEELALFNFQNSIISRKKANAINEERDYAKTFLKIGNIFKNKKLKDSSIFYNNKALTLLCNKAPMQGEYIVPNKEDLFPENAIMEAMDAQANVILNLDDTSMEKDYKIALDYINKAFEVEAMLRQYYIFDQSKYTNAVISKQRSSIAIAICNKLYTLTKNQQWLESAFLFAEKSKAIVLLDKVQENILMNQKDTILKKVKQIFLQKEILQKQIEELKNTSTDLSNEMELLKKEKDALEAEYSIVKSGINNSLFEKRENVSDVDLINKTTEILLKNNDNIVEYFVLDTTIFIFNINKRDGVSLSTTSYTNIKKNINQILPYYKSANIFNSNPEKYKTIAQYLYKALLPTYTVLKKQESIIIIPDEEISNLPFESLIDLQNEYLINQYNFKYGFSCISLIQQNNINVTYREKSIAIIAPFMHSEKNNLPMLKQTQNEVDAVEKFYKKALIVQDTNATRKAFIQSITNNATVHLASHALAALNDSTQSLIAFSDSNIYLNEIYGLTINNNLTILSACETGVGIAQQAEGNLSLARAFYYAGSKNVINSLWKVDDKSTGKIFVNFYENLNNKNNISASLYKAKLAYIKNASKEQQAPYYWSSFICIGTGEIYIKGNDYTIWYIVSFTLLLFTLFFFYKKRKSKKCIS